MKHYSHRLWILTYSLLINTVCLYAANEPIIVFNSKAYEEVGEGNRFSAFFSTYETGIYTIDMGNGEEEYEISEGYMDASTGEWVGTWIPMSVNSDGIVKIYGDATNLNIISIDGGYLETINMNACTELQVISLQHNSLQKLDLSPFTKAYAIYLTDNPFTKSTPLKIGANKPDLAILEIDIIDWLDQSFNLSDYPSLQAFDGYHNMSLYNVDPTGCPELLVLSVEMAPVSSLDLSQNTKLQRLNISETRITDIDLSHNTELQYLLAGHVSGTINTEYHIKDIDLSNNKKLVYLELSGNNMTSVDLSNNKQLSYLRLNYNCLENLDLSGMNSLYSLYIRENDMDYATLPWPKNDYYEYFYRQRPMEVPRSMAANMTLDLSNRVLRDGTETTAEVWRQVLEDEDELLSPSLYTYADGKIIFNQALEDSVYIEFTNDVFVDYKAKTKPFMVKNADELGKPSPIVTLTPKGSWATFHVGLANATAQAPKTFMVDFGNGELKEFVSKSSVDYISGATLVNGTAYGPITVYIPEGEVMTALSVSGMPLNSLDVTKATELTRLDVSECGLSELDLRFNRCLQELNMSKNEFTSIDLTGIHGDYEKNVLHNLNASDNKLTEFKVIATYAMNTLNLANNQLEDIDLENYDNLLTLNLSGNKLTEIDLNHLLAATSVDLSNNELSYVNPCETYLVQGVNLTGNKLNIATLPTPAQFGKNYTYAPQQEIRIPTQGIAGDLESSSATVNGNPTTYVWKTSDGATLAAGTDYTINGSVTRFINTEVGEVYCELSNASFPQFKNSNVLRTTIMEVVSKPTNVAGTFTTVSKNGSEPTIFLAASEPIQVYIDWSGNDSDFTPYMVETSYKQFAVENITNGAVINMYTDNADDAAKISIFSLYDIKLDNVDLSALTGAISINLGNASLTPEQLILPDAPNMNDMNMHGNQFEDFPYGANFPNLTMLNLSNNSLKSFDCSKFPSMAYLVLSKNKITELTFDNPKLWNISLEENSLETIDLNGLPVLEQIFLQDNKLESIDLTPVKNTLSVLNVCTNNLTFATLPVQSDYPNLRVYYYGGQRSMAAACQAMQVDLSAQASVNGTSTLFYWFVGKPSYDYDEYAWVGDVLTEGTDYEINNGITHFLVDPGEKVCCLMINEVLPNLELFTELIELTTSGIEDVITDNEMVTVYNLQGVLLRRAQKSEALKGLPVGIYIVNGKKVLIR